MPNTLEFIQSYLIGKTTLDKDFSLELYNFLRSYYSVEDFVTSMEDSFDNLYFAFYVPSRKKLFINWDKMVADIHKYLNSLNLSNEDKILALHLCLFHFMNHEFKHICQAKEKSENPNTIESRLLTLSDRLEHYYRREGLLFYHYKIDPIERQAELSSLSQFISMAKTENIDILSTEMTTRYLQDAREGYSGNLERNYPTKFFLEGSRYYDYEIHNLIEELNGYPITEDNFQTRIELGLKITRSENEKLKRL